MLPWLAERRESSVAEMAEQFGLTEDELVKDLMLASMCGLPPYQDELVDVFIDDDMVFTGIPRLFTRPLRLTAPEATAPFYFRVAAAGKVANLDPVTFAADRLKVRLVATPPAVLREGELLIPLTLPAGTTTLTLEYQW